MDSLFVYRGIRIRPFHKHINSIYRLLLWTPFLLVISFACFKWLYDPVNHLLKQRDLNVFPVIRLFLLPILILALSYIMVCMFWQWSFKRNGFFSRVDHRSRLAKMVHENQWIIYDNQRKKGDSRKKAKVIYRPKIFYRKKKDQIAIYFPLDGNRFQREFEELSSRLEKVLFVDGIETTREKGYLKFMFATSARSNRISVTEMQVKPNRIQLMKNIWWRIDKVSHCLITGGTNGGKTYLISSMILACLKIGQVDVCDGKGSSLKTLDRAPVFEGHVFSTKAQIIQCLRQAVEKMDSRYAYMIDPERFIYGSDYTAYDLKPYFLVIDEWQAFYQSLSRDMKALAEVDDYFTRLILKGREAGVMLIVGMQRGDANNLPLATRDNFGLRISVGKLSRTGYDMMFGSSSNEKDFYNTNEKGRGYIDAGDAQTSEFFSAYVPNSFDFFDEFKKFPKQKIDPSEKVLNENEFVASEAVDG
ncbi:FtsK/SpoIIIE domain-containing protein [Enterococcus faecalis]|uniref:FtsK/SpoIIIE domain-containing protein n=1 Tax=Enterococcus TaxID=1350 RepID=UPI00188379A0|nr:FtsK/SpoIIIE domain-containing protein [Enterococcus faecalis]MBF0006431.1 cell division protein FtsK [Enterococcus faecalis]MBF0009114.1 cell division protein FtsK [Enterococcus faecalis]MBF0018395.1 cell division protein FtsK [Enterococcus faecalis]